LILPAGTSSGTSTQKNQDSPKKSRPLSTVRAKGGLAMASLMKRPDRPTWYIQYYLAGELKRESTGT
jgi:hypothetical protein